MTGARTRESRLLSVLGLAYVVAAGTGMDAVQVAGDPAAVDGLLARFRSRAEANRNAPGVHAYLGDGIEYPRREVRAVLAQPCGYGLRGGRGKADPFASDLRPLRAAEQRQLPLERRGVHAGPALLDRLDQVPSLPAAGLESRRAARVETATGGRAGRVGDLAARQVLLAVTPSGFGQGDRIEQ